MGGLKTQRVTLELAKVGAETLIEKCENLALTLDIVETGLLAYSSELKKLNLCGQETIEATFPKLDMPALLMLPAPEKQKPKRTRCSVCQKFCGKDETLCKKCKEKKKEC